MHDSGNGLHDRVSTRMVAEQVYSPHAFGTFVRQGAGPGHPDYAVAGDLVDGADAMFDFDTGFELDEAFVAGAHVGDIGEDIALPPDVDLEDEATPSAGSELRPGALVDEDASGAGDGGSGGAAPATAQTSMSPHWQHCWSSQCKRSTRKLNITGTPRTL